MPKIYTLEMRQAGDGYEVTVPELVGVRAHGVTVEEALENARHAIAADRLRALEAAKAVWRGRRKKTTVAS